MSVEANASKNNGLPWMALRLNVLAKENDVSAGVKLSCVNGMESRANVIAKLLGAAGNVNGPDATPINSIWVGVVPAGKE